MSETPQEAGRRWERELAMIVGGKLQPGSGNAYYARGDLANGGAIIWSAKATIHNSFSVSRAVIDDARTMALGPGSASSDVVDVLAYRLGDGTMRADLDLMQLVAWIAAPPEIVPASSMDGTRKAARTPSLLR